MLDVSLTGGLSGSLQTASIKTGNELWARSTKTSMD
jgi:hypothetical protein